MVKKPVKKGGKNMYKKSNINLKGFTIIEVVLVLAVAALIIAGVFVALPALQSSQKDNDQKSKVNQGLAKAIEYYGNNNNTMPSDCSGAQNATPCNKVSFGSYMTAVGLTLNIVKDDGGQAGASEFTPPTYPAVSVRVNAKCADNTVGTAGNYKTSTNAGKFAIVTKLQSGLVYCANNT